jgi:hypothetical protein
MDQTHRHAGAKQPSVLQPKRRRLPQSQDGKDGRSGDCTSPRETDQPGQVVPRDRPAPITRFKNHGGKKPYPPLSNVSRRSGVAAGATETNLLAKYRVTTGAVAISRR